MSNTTLSIHEDNGKIHHVDAPTDIKAKDFLKELLEELQPGTNDAQLQWSLHDDSGRALDPDRTLGESGVRTGQQLYLRRQKKSVTCPSCSFENPPENKFCQKCGQILGSAAAPGSTPGRAAAASASTATAPARITTPAEIRLHVHTPDGGGHSTEVPSDLKVSELIEDLVLLFKLPGRDSSGAEIIWILDDKESGRTLQREKSLQENGVLTGQHLDMRRFIPPPLPPAPRPGSPWKIVVGLGVVAILGIAAFLWYRSQSKPNPTPVILSVEPRSAVLQASETQEFKARVTGSDNKTVRWSVNPEIGTISAEGLYKAPSVVPAEQTVTVRATSEANPTSPASATVTLMPARKAVATPTAAARTPTPMPSIPVSVVVTPGGASISQGQKQAFGAKVNGANNKMVRWTLSPAIGTISAQGLYEAPALIPSEQTVRVIATSVADPRKSGSAMVTLVSPVFVTVTPAGASLKPDKKQTFKANVTGTNNKAVQWSINPPDVGTISNKGEYRSPKNTPAREVRITATSTADPHKSGSATVTLEPKK